MSSINGHRQEIPAVAARRSALPETLSSLSTRRRGRPSKFGRASRAVTVTLPEDVIDRLTTLNVDISRAIVQLAERAGPRRAALAPVEVSEFGKGALIVVSPVAALRKLPGVDLIPLKDGRALITLESPISLSRLELELRDALEGDTQSPADRETLEGIAKILRRARQSRGMSLRTRTIIVVESRRRPRAASRRHASR